MCGLAGFLGGLACSADEAPVVLDRMISSLRHRGPDDGGRWIDAEGGVAIGHRRLAVLDLSAAGHQPMVSPSGRYVLSFNGEIYNHLDLRTAMGGPWIGTSDTETLARGVECWGLATTLRKAAGMFALAVWDREMRVLSLGRDRFGEKPLYYGWQGQSFLFGSELKALAVHPDFEHRVDAWSARDYVARGYVATPWSIYSGIGKVAPGTIVTVEPSRRGELRSIESFWNLWDTVSQARTSITSDIAAATEQLDQRLRAIVRRQMVADVPVGVFLSGGIDSSLVTAMMQAESSRPIRTFTVGFKEWGYDEALHAQAVARHLGTEHTEYYVTDDDAAAIIPDLPVLYDEPFGDASAIPTTLIARLARQSVTVALSGDGGDELFGGYVRYSRTAQLWQRIQRFPRWTRHIGAAISRLPLPGFDRRPAITRALLSRNALDLYDSLVLQWPSYAPGSFSDRRRPSTDSWPTGLIPVEQMMLRDSVTYLPDDVLCKVDRATMAASLETRVPFLDHDLAAFAWSLDADLKVRDGAGKLILKHLLERYVPSELTDRPKTGFAVPVDHWLRGRLRDWAEDLLSESSLARSGLLEVATIRRRWRQHLAGSHNWRDPLWVVLQLQAWLRHNRFT